MERSVPYITLDPQTGEMIARYEDGTVSRWPTEGTLDASTGLPGIAGTRGRARQIRGAARSTSLPRSDGATGGGFDPGRDDRAGAPIPPPERGGYGNIPDPASRLADARSRLAAARARIAAATGGGGYSGGDYGRSSYADSTPKPDKPDPLHGRYAHGLDPTQAGGLTLHPTAMIPRVFPGLNPSDPVYGMLARLPAAQWAMILGNGKPQSIANKLGGIYHDAGMRSDLPSTDRLLSQLRQGNGLEDMFQGVKAGKHDYESYSQPGYVYGQEPMPMGEATSAYGTLLDAALSQEPMLTAQKYGVMSGGWGSYLIDKWASKAMKRPPGKGKPIYSYVGKKLFK